MRHGDAPVPPAARGAHPGRGGRRLGPGSLVLLPLVLLTGCAAEPEGPAVVTRDSAGVTIVESERPAWGRDGGWRVGSEPVLRIGVVEGEAAYQLAQVVGAVRLGDGGVAVADAGAQEVRFFGPEGRVRQVVGGTGSGPGEFTGLSSLGAAPGGGVWAYDLPLRRITWLDAGGDVRGMLTLPSEPALLAAVGVAGSSFVLKQLWGARAVAGSERVGLRRDPIAYVTVDTATAAVDTLGLFPGREVYVSDEGGRGVMSRPALARNSVAAVRDGQVVIGSQATWELAEYALDGTLLRRVRLPAELQVDPADVERAIDRYVEAVEPERRPGLRAMLERMPEPATRPAYGALLADRAGRLWVSDWSVIHTELPERWTVLDTDGRWLGAVEMPERFYPLDIGGDWILGTERDAMDVEYVVVYPLVREGT